MNEIGIAVQNSAIDDGPETAVFDPSSETKALADRLRTFDDANYAFSPSPELKDNVITFGVYWAAKHCLRMMALNYLGLPADIPRKKRLHMIIGKVVETIQKRMRKGTLTSIEEGYELVNTALAVLEPEEQIFAMQRITELLRRSLELDAQAEKQQTGTKRQKRFAPQFYATISVKTVRGEETFRLPAKPDQMDMLGFDEESGLAPDKIVILDDKSGGRSQQKTEEHLRWFGLVVSLWAQRKVKEGEWKLKPHQQGKRQRGYHLSRKRQRPPVPPIEYLIRLMGKRRQPDGTLVDAPQPAPVKYDTRLEESRLNDVRHVIKQVVSAFEDNHFPPTVNADCRSCDYKGSCPAYAAWAQLNPELSGPRRQPRRARSGRIRRQWQERQPQSDEVVA